jgi:Uma2 family endonuclease
MSTQLASYQEIIERLPEASELILHGVTWEEYEQLLEEVGEASGLRISYDEGELRVMTLSSEHESYCRLIDRLVDRVSFRLRKKVLFFGSMTMKKPKKRGSEPDACFYVQSADLIKNNRIDLGTDPPPDIAVEIDISHDSVSKLGIYAALGVPELWLYDGEVLRIYRLERDEYVGSETSLALPLLSSTVLSQFLNRSRQEDQYQTLLAFEEWLRTASSAG